MSPLEDANVTVTGGAGFIGFHLCNELLRLRNNVLIYDNLSNGSIKNIEDLHSKKVNFVRGDIKYLEKTQNEVKECKTIFHLAAQVSVAYSMENPLADFETNVLGTMKVLEKARTLDARVVFASTSAVYGNPQKNPTSEDDPIRPISFYGLSKLLGEEQCRFYYATYKLPIVILRIFNVYGPRGHGVTRDFIDNLGKNPSELKILGTGDQIRDFFYVSDMVEALILCAQSQKAVGQTYNVGSGTTITIRELAQIMIELLGLKDITQTSYTGGEAWEGDMQMNHADISKVRNELNWQPRVLLKDGLRRMIEEEKFRRM